MAPRARGVVWTDWAQLVLGELLDTIAAESPSGAKTVAAEVLDAVTASRRSPTAAELFLSWPIPACVSCWSYAIDCSTACAKTGW